MKKMSYWHNTGYTITDDDGQWVGNAVDKIQAERIRFYHNSAIGEFLNYMVQEREKSLSSITNENALSVAEPRVPSAKNSPPEGQKS